MSIFQTGRETHSTRYESSDLAEFLQSVEQTSSFCDVVQWLACLNVDLAGAEVNGFQAAMEDASGGVHDAFGSDCP